MISKNLSYMQYDKQCIDQRYPTLGNVLSLFCISADSKRTRPKATVEFSKIPSDRYVLILYGIGFVDQYQSLLQFLDENPKHECMIIEDQLEDLALYYPSKNLSALCKHNRFHLTFLQPGYAQDAIHSIVDHFLYQQFYALQAREKSQKKYNNLIVELSKQSAIGLADMSEQLGFKEVYYNVCHHLLNIHTFYDVLAAEKALTGKRCIICGSGPSLNADFELLKQHQDDLYIIAAGSAMTPLMNHGITPHLCVVIDATLSMYEKMQFSKTNSTIPVIIPRLNPEVLTLFEKDPVLIPSPFSTNLDFAVMEKLKKDPSRIDPTRSETIFSVTALCIELAIFCGFKHIAITGVDLCRETDRLYADGLNSTTHYATSTIPVKTLLGADKLSTAEWLHDSNWIQKRLAGHRESSFVDVRLDGLDMGLKRQTLKSFLESSSDATPCTIDELESALYQSKFSLSDTSCCRQFLYDFHNSLKLCLNNIQAVLKLLKSHSFDHPKVLVEVSDLKEEVAFNQFLVLPYKNLEKLCTYEHLRKWEVMKLNSSQKTKMYSNVYKHLEAFTVEALRLTQDCLAEKKPCL